MYRFFKYTLLVAFSFGWVLPAAAVQVTGSIAVEARAFIDTPQFNRQRDGINASVLLAPEVYHVSENRKHTVTFAPFLRLDQHDAERTHVDVREANWLYASRDFEIKVGASKVFWGVTESRHLVDVINQTDAIESVDGEDKLGQPMVQLALFKEWGRLRLFALPYFRERTFPGPRGRLGGPLPIDTELATYESSSREHRLDTAIRYEHSVGGWDFGIAHFNGTSREPVLRQGVNAANEPVFIPHYNVIDQTSLDAQLTYDAWLLKFEGITVDGQGERFNAISTGFEYTFFGVQETDIDVGVLAEYHRDDRGGDAPGTSFDDDVFMGMRVVLNDVPDTQFLAGVIVDRFTKNRAYSIEAERRMSDTLKLELEGRFFSGKATQFSRNLSEDSHMILTVSRFF